MNKQIYVVTDDSFEKSLTMQKALAFSNTSPYDPPAWEYGSEIRCGNVIEAMDEAERILYFYGDEPEPPVDKPRHYVLWTPKQETASRKHQEMWHIAMDVFVKFQQETDGYIPIREPKQPLEQPRNIKFHPSGYIHDESQGVWIYHEST